MNVKFFGQAVDVFLEVEVREEKAAAFESEYYNIAGVIPVLGSGYQHQPNKWGLEARVYFNGTPRLLRAISLAGLRYETGRRPYHSRRAFRINNNDFFWSLVQSGYRLGEN